MFTVPFGRLYEPYMDADEYYDEDPPSCDCCGNAIIPGADCYYINYRYFCMHCEDAARDEIFERERESYLIKCE